VYITIVTNLVAALKILLYRCVRVKRERKGERERVHLSSVGVLWFVAAEQVSE
jgi:hypothetical protein